MDKQNRVNFGKSLFNKVISLKEKVKTIFIIRRNLFSNPISPLV
jgi:hypothetical protein